MSEKSLLEARPRGESRDVDESNVDDRSSEWISRDRIHSNPFPSLNQA